MKADFLFKKANSAVMKAATRSYQLHSFIQLKAITLLKASIFS